MSATPDKQTLGFQSEVRQLLDLVIHSLYGNREVFLRELISNASDALDKLRFEALGSDSLYEGDAELAIRIEFSPTLKTITVSDNGIGMSREEVVSHLGTIAKSGTREFFGRLTGDQQKDSQLIGQFGVGFYSAFIVADRVTVVTRRAGASTDDAVRWESDGTAEFTVEATRKKQRGTEVILSLREDAAEFLDDLRLRGIVHKYSEHIAWPIMMSGGEGGGDERVNSATALWTRSKKDITDDEYEAFYRHIAHDFEAPLARLHTRVEGSLEYITLFFVPAHAPFDLWDRDARRGVRLYVRRVFIMDDAEKILPRYLRFVRGVVDSSDLPLNVSREILQQNRIIDSIRSASVKRLLGLIEEMSADAAQYSRFWPAFGRVLKEGIVEDEGNRERIAKLLRYASSEVEGEAESTGLVDYVARSKEGQRYIYYATGESITALRSSPHLEVFRRNGIEVLLMADPIDEWVVTHLDAFDGRPLKSISKGSLDLAGLAPEHAATATHEIGAFKDLLRRVRDVLGEDVKDVRISERLTDSAACLVADEHDLGAHLERILRASGQQVPASRAVLELNPEHPLVRQLEQSAESDRFAEWVRLLYEQALLASGGKLDDPAAFVRRMNALLVAATAVRG